MLLWAKYSSKQFTYTDQFNLPNNSVRKMLLLTTVREQSLLSTNYVLGIVLGSGDTEVG